MGARGHEHGPLRGPRTEPGVPVINWLRTRLRQLHGRIFIDEDAVDHADDPAFATVSVLGSGQIIRHHGPAVCDGWPCCIHHPSDHWMVSWPLYLDTSGPVPLMWRVCEHDIGHVDPDTMDWLIRSKYHLLVDNDECDECCGGICSRYGFPEPWMVTR